ncbi:MAG: YybH family protein [Acidimicrobiales bacterium]
MADSPERERAMTPEDIPRLFVQLVEAGDWDGLVTLYEPDAILARGDGEIVHGNTAIAATFAQGFRGQPLDVSGNELQPVLRAGDLALTSTRRRDGRVTAEVAHRQPDGSWRWVIDQPDV